MHDQSRRPSYEDSASTRLGDAFSVWLLEGTQLAKAAYCDQARPYISSTNNDPTC
jgi:hypothetical protein